MMFNIKHLSSAVIAIRKMPGKHKSAIAMWERTAVGARIAGIPLQLRCLIYQAFVDRTFPAIPTRWGLIVSEYMIQFCCEKTHWLGLRGRWHNFISTIQQWMQASLPLCCSLHTITRSEGCVLWFIPQRLTIALVQGKWVQGLASPRRRWWEKFW